MTALYAVSLPLAYWFWFGHVHGVPPSTNNAETWGTFGDFIGGLLNPVVAFLALYWLTRSISIQREELRDSKLALQSANAAQLQQAATLEKQRFEDTFFSLLDQHNKVLESINNREPIKGAKSIVGFAYEFTFQWAPENDLSSTNARFKELDEGLGHYFRILYQLLKLIALRAPTTTLVGEFSPATILATRPSSDEKLYSNIVRSFLSTRLTQLLAINCYADDEGSTYWTYKCLVERYQFLEHMPFDDNGKNHPALNQALDYYSKDAFGRSELLPRGNR